MAERRGPGLPTILVLGESTGGKDVPTKAVHYLTVDETKRPRANSDPVGLHFSISDLPEITVTADDAEEGASNEDDELDNFLVPPPPRPRANTCPEDMFLQRKERPPTPPPTDIAKSPGVMRKRFNFFHSPKDLNGVSFVHHKLYKVSEDGAGVGTPSRLNGHRRHSTGRRASCLAALSESCGLLEEEECENENDDDVLSTPSPIGLSHSMDALSLASGSVSLDKTVSGGGGPDDKNGKVLMNCSAGTEMGAKSCTNTTHVLTSNSSVR